MSSWFPASLRRRRLPRPEPVETEIERRVDAVLDSLAGERNAEPLWIEVRRLVGNELTVLWRDGKLQGKKLEEAFFVRCDRTTMTQADLDAGRLVVLVGFAPVKPAEFVILRFQRPRG